MPKSLLDLPPELLLKIGNDTGTMTAFAETCKTLHFIFAAELNTRAQRDAKQLMEYVLNPIPENIVKAKAMVAANPRIMFIKTDGVEQASGLEEYDDEETGQPATRVVHRRIVNCSPLQAVLGTGDSELYNDMAAHFDKVVYRDDGNGEVVETGRQRAQKQIKEKFPNGFDYPAIDDEFRTQIANIVTAITEDQTLKATGNPSPTTQALLAEFRKKFLPKDVTQGHHFNLNYLIEAFNVYNQNWNPWNGNQLSLFWCQVIGYLERQVTVVQAQAIREGVQNHLDSIEQKRPHSRSLSVYNNQSSSNISYFVDPPGGGALGFNFGIEIWLRAAAGYGGLARLSGWEGLRALNNYVGQTHQSLTTFSNTLSRDPTKLTQQPVSGSKCTIL